MARAKQFHNPHPKIYISRRKQVSANVHLRFFTCSNGFFYVVPLIRKCSLCAWRLNLNHTTFKSALRFAFDAIRKNTTSNGSESVSRHSCTVNVITFMQSRVCCLSTHQDHWTVNDMHALNVPRLLFWIQTSNLLQYPKLLIGTTDNVIRFCYSTRRLNDWFACFSSLA